MAIDSFMGPYRWLSNFENSPVQLGGQTYPTVEHAYQAAKTFDIAERKKIREMPKPSMAKTAGGKVKLRPDWEGVKYSIMKDLVRQKFFNHEHLKRMLLATNDEQLIEGNTWGDRYWGVCNGEGQNQLGKILMDVRKELRGW